jgi:hypothetical protein
MNVLDWKLTGFFLLVLACIASAAGRAQNAAAKPASTAAQGQSAPAKPASAAAGSEEEAPAGDREIMDLNGPLVPDFFQRPVPTQSQRFLFSRPKV